MVALPVATVNALARHALQGGRASNGAGKLNCSAKYRTSADVVRGPLWFASVAERALGHAIAIVPALLPDGRREGREWVARNPLRADRSPGSFKVNLLTGRWCDFATGDKGGDIISLGAYIAGCSQSDAAARLANALGLAVLS